MSRIAPALCSVTFRKLPYAHVLSIAVRAGIEAIEWGADVHAPVGSLGRARAIAVKSRERGVAVGSYGSYFEAGTRPAQEFREVVQTAVALGAPNIRVWAGRRGVDSKDVAPDERARTIADLRAMSEIAFETGISVALEFHRQTLTDTLASTLDVLDRVDHANLFTYWQPRPGVSLSDAQAEIEALRPRLSHLHVFNWNEHRERFLLEDAQAFWPQIFEQVGAWDDATPARRLAMIEFVRGDDLSAFGRDAVTLRKWIGAHAVGAALPQGIVT